MAMQLLPTTVLCGVFELDRPDLEKYYSQFIRFLKVEEYNKTIKDPEKWMPLYIEAIKNLEKSHAFKVICVSSAGFTRKSMQDAGIKYTNLYLEDSDKMFEMYMKHTHPEIKDLWNNIKVGEYRLRYSHKNISLREDTGSVRNIELTPATFNGWERSVLLR